ncbi:hypothetical protein HY008_02100 [Candidatus Woesebacteria bacterium]|nr:hypothetical protein [Candidatus Woesebacteria bacterium]
MKKTARGQSLVELLIAIGLTSLFLPALITGLIASRSGKAQQIQRAYAIALLKEGEEALRNVREAGWNTFAINGTFHPATAGTSWTLVNGPENINGFTRSITIRNAFRNASGNLVLSGGSVDPSTKRVIIIVSWNSPFFSSIDSDYYMTRYLDNASYIQTTEADFLTGVRAGTTVTNDAGGEVTLSAGGRGDWCKPNTSIVAQLDLPKQGVANAISSQEGRIFAGTGENASGVSLADINVTNTNPPVPSILGTVDGYKTNDVFVDSPYGYVATDTNSSEIVIIDLSNYQAVGSFDSPGPGDANSIFVSGSIGYMTAGNMLYTFDLSAKTGSRPAKDPDGVILAGVGSSIYVAGGYAYVAVDSTSSQLQIVDVQNPNNLVVVGQAVVAGLGGKDVFVNSAGIRAYLATANSSGQNEFFIIDTSTKTGTRPTLGSYDTSGMDPKGVRVVTGNKAIVVGTSAEEYQVINIADEANPVRCGGLNFDTGVNGVSSVIETDGDAYSYIITGDAGVELKVIEGGPGGQYASSGTYESETFDPGYETAFNRFYVNIGEPPGTDLTFQIAVADGVGGSCSGANFNFVGPDGTSDTFYTDDGVIPLNDDGVGYENPGRCFRYRAYFSTSESTSTPILYDVTVNYSP